MNESIGVKGGHNDFKRVFKITQKEKEKLKKHEEEQKIKELEKELKRKQKYILIKTLPLIIIGNTFNKNTKKEVKEEFIKDRDISKQETKEETNKTKKVVIILEDGKKQIIEIPTNINIDKEIISLSPKEEVKDLEKEIKKEEKVKEEIQNTIPIPIVEEKEIKEKDEIKEKEEIKESKNKENINKETSDIVLEELSFKQRNKLQKLQMKKIVDVYEKELKEIRYELRNLIIDYNTLIDEEERIIKKSEEERILDKLNEIIAKIEILKNKIKIEDLDKYDDNYIYTLIEEYLIDFKDKKIVEEIKDSKLYIAISTKLEELDKKKEDFKDKVETKKDELEVKEENFDKLKEKYSKIDKINKDIKDFYDEQEILLEELKEKIDKCKTITEKTEVQVEMMNLQTRSLLKRLALIMILPGAKGVKALTAMANIYAHISTQMLNPKTTTKKYQIITVEDYSRDILENLKKFDEVESLISKTSKDIDNLIIKIKEDFKDYIGVIRECDELLSNLEKVKRNINEKEYEIKKIKEKEQKELERNNAKILTRGKYQM